LRDEELFFFDWNEIRRPTLYEMKTRQWVQMNPNKLLTTPIFTPDGMVEDDLHVYVFPFFLRGMSFLGSRIPDGTGFIVDSMQTTTIELVSIVESCPKCLANIL